MKKTYYWYCPKCGKNETYSESQSLSEAKHELEKHELEKHNKQPVGNFGWVKAEN